MRTRRHHMLEPLCVQVRARPLGHRITRGARYTRASLVGVPLSRTLHRTLRFRLFLT